MRDELCRLIPHAADMCLLDKVLHWDQSNIHCQASSHRSPNHPLREPRGLASVHAIEYAAQTMAVHGGLLILEQGGSPSPGYVVALKQVRLHVRWLHDIPDILHIQAQALLQSSAAMIYRFHVNAAGNAIAEGRITVMNQTGTTS